MFELSRGEVAEGGVPAGRVIEGLDIIEDHGSGLSAGGGELVVEAFGFEGGPEGLGGGVVVAVPATAHALLDAELLESGGEAVAGVLGALIAVVDEIGRRVRSTSDGFVERFQNETGLQVVSGGPADDLAGEQIDLCGEEEHAFLSGNVSDVGNPDLAGLGGRRKSQQALRGRSATVRAVGGARDEAAFLIRTQALLAHESGDAAAAATVSTCEQILAQSWSAVGLAALAESRRDLGGEQLVLLAARTVIFSKVVVESTATDLQSLTELLEGEFALSEEEFDQRVNGGGSWLKMPKAFFKMSR